MPPGVSDGVCVRVGVQIEFEPPRSWARRIASVQFVARRGSRFLRCYVTREALIDCFGAVPLPGDEGQGECLRAFDRYRGTIEQLARRELEAAPARSVLILTTDDVHRHLASARRLPDVDLAI